MSVFARMMGQRAPAMGGPLGMASAGGIVATPEQNARQAALEAQFGINPLAGARVPDVPMQTVDVPASGGAPVGASPFGRIEVNQPGAGSPFNPATLQRSLGQIEGMTPEVKAGGGVFARIGDFLGSDEGRAALLRSGAATLQGGLGAGIAAGAGFVDQRHREAAQQAERDRQFGLQSRGVDIKQQQADNQSMNVASQIRDRAIQQGIDVAKLEEARRKARAGEALDAQELASLNWYRQVQAGLESERIATTRRGQDFDMARHNTPSASTVYAADSARYSSEEDRANRLGLQTTTVTRDDAGRETGRAVQTSPEYGEIRFDPQGNAFRLDAFSGRAIPVPRMNRTPGAAQ